MLRQETTYYITPPPKETLQPNPNPQPNMPLTPTASLQYSNVSNPEEFVKEPPTGGIPSPEYFKYSNLTPVGQAKVREAALNTALLVGTPIAVAVAPVPAVIGAGLGLGISQGIKGVQGQGLLTPSEAFQSAAGGAIFSVVGGEIIGGLGLAPNVAKGLVPSVARIGINTGLGAGAGSIYEYASQGKVTSQGPLFGASFGAAFGAVGEAIGYGAPKIKAYATEKLSESYGKTLEPTKPIQAPKLGEAYTEVNPETLVAKPSKLHGIGQFTTEKIEPGTALPTPKEGHGFNWSEKPNVAFNEEGKFVTLRSIQKGEELTVPNYSTETLESKSFKLWQPTIKEQVLMKLTGAKPNSTEITSKATNMLTESYELNAKENIELMRTDGYRNVPFGTEPDLEVRAALSQMDVQGKMWTPNLKEAEMIKYTGASPKLASGIISTSTKYVNEPFSPTGFKAGMIAEEDFDFGFAPKSSLQTTYSQQATVATAKIPIKPPVYFGLGTPYQPGIGNKAVLTDFKEVPYQQGREQPIEKGLPENPIEIDARLSRDPLSFKDPRMYYGSGENDYVSYKPPTQIAKPPSKGGMKPLWENEVSKSEPKVETPTSPISQVTVQEPKATISKQSTPFIETITSQVTTKGSNPFVQFTGRTFYKQYQQPQYEEEITFVSVPKSVLAHPQQPKTVTDISQKQPQIPLTSQPNIFKQTSEVGLTEILQPETKTIPIPELLTNNAQTNLLNVDTTQMQNPFQDFRVIPTEGVSPIQIPTIIQPRTTPKEILPPYTPLIPKSNLPFIPIGGKFEGTGYSQNPFKIGGLESRRRVYPIFSGEEVLKL